MDRMARLLALLHLLTEEYGMVRAIRGAKCIPEDWSGLVTGFARGVRLAILREGGCEIWIVADSSNDLISCKTRLILLQFAGRSVEKVTWLEPENIELIHRLGAEPERMYASLAVELAQRSKYHVDLLKAVTGGSAAASAARTLEHSYRPFDHRERIRDTLRGLELGTAVIRIEWDVMPDGNGMTPQYCNLGAKTAPAAKWLVKLDERGDITFSETYDGRRRTQQLLGSLGRVGQWATVTYVTLTESFDLDDFVKHVGPGVKSVVVQ